MSTAVEVTRLRNGVTVATHPMPHLESVAMGVWVGAGARSEAPSEHGMSHLLEHMAFKGTRRRSARDIAETTEETTDVFQIDQGELGLKLSRATG